MLAALTNWDVRIDRSLSRTDRSNSENLIWQDGNGPLAISQICMSESTYYRLRMGCELYVDVHASRLIVANTSPTVSKTTLDHFLADQVLPRAMAHEGDFVLHAGAVRLGNAAILLMGTSGRGKSTLATSFDQAGLPLLGDDAMVISWHDDRPQAKAVYPSLRLLPDSIEALFPTAIKTTSVADYTQKRRVDVSRIDADRASLLPIKAIFSIAGPGDDLRITLRRLSIAEACMACVESSFALDPADLDRARGRLDDASALAGQIPAFEISYPRDFARLPEVRQAILDQLDQLDAS